MNFDFSIIIPTYNGEKTIGRLLKRLVSLAGDYNKEVIIIDSQSTDKTLFIATKYKKKLNLKTLKIEKCDFNHGGTRNIGVKIAQGKFIYFLSQDAIPLNKNILNYYIEDFKINKKIVAVFGKHIPYKNTPIIQKFEVICRWERLDKFTNKKGILIYDKQHPFIIFSKENSLDWYVISNTSCCYKRSFLIKNLFSKSKYGEDLMLGKRIIDMGFLKVYDLRCSVLHSHTYNLIQYFRRENEDLKLRLLHMNLGIKLNIFCKFKKIVTFDCTLLQKFLYICQLCFYYMLKIIIISQFHKKDEAST